MPNKPILKVGTVGWDQGHAFKILCTRKTPYGRIFVTEVVHFEEFNRKKTRVHPVERVYKRKSGWVEAQTEKYLRDCDIGFDCNGSVPPAHLFKR